MARKKTNKTKSKKVICATCKSSFEPIFDDKNDQAMDCSATVTDIHIWGHYGSTVIDMQLWNWINRPNNVKNGNMCDKCIQKYIDSSNLILEADRIW